jgi:hypothetical protein
VRAPGVEAKVATPPPSDESVAFFTIEAPARDDWAWPIGRFADLDPSPLWLAHEGRADALALDVSTLKPTSRAEVDVRADVDRAGISYRETIRLEMAGGLLDDFELSVPAGVKPDWSIEGLEVSTRYPVAIDADGGGRYRVVLARKGVRSVSFELRYATTFDRPLEESSPLDGRFVWIRPTAATQGSVRLTCLPSSGLGVEVDPEGWQKQTPPPEPSGSPIGLSRQNIPDRLPEFRATAAARAQLPALVVSRAYLRTVRGSEELRTTAVFRIETHGPSVVVALPRGWRWIGASLDGAAVDEVESDGVGGRRIDLGPAPGKEPRILAIESAAASRGGPSWQPPVLVGAVGGETYWAVVVPVSQAVLGTPAGWSDENGWRWMGYVWMKTPLRSDDELLGWVAAGAAPIAEPGDERATWRTNQHAYLFRKPDGLAPLPVLAVPRSLLLMTSSGAIALIGLGLVLAGPRRRPFAVLAVALLLMFAIAWEPGLMLQALPAGVLGLLLTLVAAVLQWTVNRRRAATGGRFASASVASTPSSSPSVAVAVPVGSDDSTAIRRRPPEEAGAFVIPAAPSPEAASSISEIGGRP